MGYAKNRGFTKIGLTNSPIYGDEKWAKMSKNKNIQLRNLLIINELSRVRKM
jgi:hypothetical protein